jgi:hypothetical protein
MRIDELQREFACLTIECPPVLWEAEAGHDRVAPLLRDMIAAFRSRGAAAGDLTLNLSNVVVEPYDDGDERVGPEPGSYVALTVAARADIGPDDRWSANAPASSAVLIALRDRFEAAGARFAYVRFMPPAGSLTVFVRARERP